MISYKPSRCNNAHIVLPLLLILAGVVAILGSTGIKVFVPAVLQGIGVLLFSIATYIINRYSLTTVYYTIGEDTPDLLCVHRITGNKKTTPVSVDLAKARSVTRMEEGFESQAKRRVNMCLNIFPRERVAILFGEGTESTELIIEADDIFFEQIRERIGG